MAFTSRVWWNRTVDADATDADAVLLSDALGLPASVLRPFSREPLGEGTVTGFELRGVDSLPPSPDLPDLPDGTVAYVDTSRLPVVRETGLSLEGRARVWLHPADPHLPALAPAAYGDAAAVLLARLGAADAGAPRIVGYRPGRRAVLCVPTADGDLWVKVVRPRRIERVVAAHTRLRDHGVPVPAVRGWSPDGLLVLDSAVGVPATEAVWEPEALLDSVDDLRSRLAGAPLDWPARTSLAARLPWYLERLRDAMPGEHERIDGLEREVSAALDRATAHEATPRAIHGDLHLGQLFVDEGGRVASVIDVDTAGRGRAAEDAAAFVGHAISSALLTARLGRDATRVWALADAAERRWVLDSETRGLTSVHLLGHAVGAASGGDPERASRLLDHAARVASTGRPAGQKAADET